MPSLSNEEIKTAIADGNVFAISIDTSVFDAKQKTFRNAVLLRLDQFQKRDVRVVIADVVANEMKLHLRDDAQETQRALKKALRAHNNRWSREGADDESNALLVNSDAVAFADAEFETFLKLVDGEVIEASETPDVVESVLTRYFAAKAPFGTTDKRKSEFPDAFALLALEAFAAEERKLLICVAPDKGWGDFAAESEYLVCVDKLEDALSLFNAADQHLVDAVVQRWRAGADGEFLEMVRSAIGYRLEDLDFGIDAYADVEFDAEPVSAILQSLSAEKVGDPTVIAVDGETVTFTIKVEALVEFGASFEFYVMDSVDRDYVNLNSAEIYTEKDLSFDLTITAYRDLADGPVFHEVEVARKPFEVHFGHVDAFPNEDPTYEKY